MPGNALDDFGDYPIHAGSFMLTPSLKLEQQYDTNICATESSVESDNVTILEPSLNIKKSIRDHQFNLNLKGAAYRYWSHSSEDVENYQIDFDSRIVAHSTLKIPLGIRYDIGHKQRLQERTASTSRADKPTKFHSLKAETGLEYQPNRLLLGLYGGYNESRFDDGVTSLGTPVIRKDGDYDRYNGEALIRYETAREWSPFARLLVGKTDFLRRSFNGTSFSGTNRDNRLVRAQGGLGFNLKDLLTGSIALGKDWRTYDDDTVSNVSDTSAEASATWNVDEATSFVFDFSRRSEEDNEINNAVLETKYSAELNYELQQDLFLHSLLGYETDEFNSSGRKDDTYRAGVGLSYILTPRFQIGGDIVYNTRDSNSAGSDYDQTRFILRLTGSL